MRTVQSIRGDLTSHPADALVNAANSSLLGGGGVDGAMHAAAGPELLNACRQLRATRFPHGLPVGHAVATPGFQLVARWVIHTVGPNAHRGETDPTLLAACFHNSLEVAAGLGLQSVAFPAISAGAFGWDIGAVAPIAWAAVLEHGPSSIEQVSFVLVSAAAHQAFLSADPRG
ncbi:MAG: O-acetyl-ADP-ribose deacetylase [Propioniciclava sp.]